MKSSSEFEELCKGYSLKKFSSEVLQLKKLTNGQIIELIVALLAAVALIIVTVIEQRASLINKNTDVKIAATQNAISITVASIPIEATKSVKATNDANEQTRTLTPTSHKQLTLGDDFKIGCISTQLWKNSEEITMAKIPNACGEYGEGWNLDSWNVSTLPIPDENGIKIYDLNSTNINMVDRSIFSSVPDSDQPVFSIEFDLTISSLTKASNEENKYNTEFAFGIGTGTGYQQGSFLKFYGDENDVSINFGHSDLQSEVMDYYNVVLNEPHHVKITVDGTDAYVKIGDYSQIGPLNCPRENRSFYFRWKYFAGSNVNITIENLEAT